MDCQRVPAAPLEHRCAAEERAERADEHGEVTAAEGELLQPTFQGGGLVIELRATVDQPADHAPLHAPGVRAGDLEDRQAVSAGRGNKLGEMRPDGVIRADNEDRRGPGGRHGLRERVRVARARRNLAECRNRRDHDVARLQRIQGWDARAERSNPAKLDGQGGLVQVRQNAGRGEQACSQLAEGRHG